MWWGAMFLPNPYSFFPSSLPVRDGLLRRQLTVAVEELVQVEARLEHLQPLVRVRLDGAARQEVLCAWWFVTRSWTRRWSGPQSFNPKHNNTNTNPDKATNAP